MPKTERHEVSAGGVVFRRRRGQPLVVLILDKHGNWGFPKGHLHRGETALDAARREIREETGLDELRLHGPLDVAEWSFNRRGRVINKSCYFYVFETDIEGLCPQLDEGITEAGWFDLDEARRTLTFEQARGVLRRAAEALVGSGRVVSPQGG